jgi:hypothetical protein
MQTADKFSLDLSPLYISLYYYIIWTTILTAVYITNMMTNVIVMVVMIMMIKTVTIMVMVGVVVKWNLGFSQWWQEWQTFSKYTTYLLKPTNHVAWLYNNSSW